MKKSKKDKNLLPKKKTISLSTEEFCVLNDLFVQFFIAYDDLNNPNVLMNIKGFKDKDHCLQWIEEFKQIQEFNFINDNETIH